MVKAVQTHDSHSQPQTTTSQLGSSELLKPTQSYADHRNYPSNSQQKSQVRKQLDRFFETMNPPPPVHIKPSSPRLTTTITPTPDGTHRKVAIAVDLSEESAFAVRWAVQNYLRPGDSVVLLHVRPTSVLYGADWGSVDPNDAVCSSSESQQKLEDDFDAFITTKAADLAQPLVEAQFPFKVHIVKDHDMKERLCLEVERLWLSVVIMGSRGFGAAKRAAKVGRLGSVTDYCVQHCVRPVVVVRYPDDSVGSGAGGEPDGPVELHPVPEEDPEEFNDGSSSDNNEAHEIE